MVQPRRLPSKRAKNPLPLVMVLPALSGVSASLGTGRSPGLVQPRAEGRRSDISAYFPSGTPPVSLALALAPVAHGAHLSTRATRALKLVTWGKASAVRSRSCKSL